MGVFDLGDYGPFNLTDPGGEGIDFGNFNLGGGGVPKFDSSEIDFGWPSTNFDLGRYAGWPKFDTGDMGDGPKPTNWGDILNNIGKGGLIFKNIAEPALGIEKAIQMSKYSNDYAKYVKAQNDYIKKKQEYDAKFMGEFDQAQEQFHAANEEFQGQIMAASEQANGVLQEYLNAAKPLLAQSQEMLVPGVAALARGEVPEAWQPILDAAKQKATAAAMQSMISAGMSPDDARASIGPKVDQDAHQMLLTLATSLVQQGLATGAQGGQFLQGAGQMTSILGQLAAAGMSPYSQEFQTLANIIGHITGGNDNLVPPGKPVA